MRKTINLRTKEKIEMLDNLRTLLVAGIPIITALDELIEESKGPVHKVLLSVRHDVSEGKSLFSSLDALENTMDKVTLNLIKSAEQSGSLEETLKDIIIFLKRSEEFSSKIKAALLYPTMVVALFLGILLIILYYVIPRISSVFYKLKVDIPITTRVLIIVSNFFVENTVAILSGLLFISVMVSVLYHFKKRSLQTLTFSLPLMEIWQKNLILQDSQGTLRCCYDQECL
ncbi:type II secretion system F family protein [Candidatus Nomurabacteria bacterium]|nr:type II secretion system F family protein [Candidatus Nomurabacteria bacterium]MCB9827931.1 type II secretion system F family protein [Candidatus Nomurabacteria bacterium]